jgi:hypothetical protein
MMMHRFLPYPIQHTYTLQDFYRLQSPPYHLFLLSQQTLSRAIAIGLLISKSNAPRMRQSVDLMAQSINLSW